LSDENNFGITVSDRKSDLDSFIERDEIQLYYSEITNDKRILSKNK